MLGASVAGGEVASSAVGVAGHGDAGLVLIFGVEGAGVGFEEGMEGVSVCAAAGCKRGGVVDVGCKRGCEGVGVVGVGCEGGGEEEGEEEREGKKHGRLIARAVKGGMRGWLGGADYAAV